MRWPIQIQLLLPMLAVVVVTIVLVSVVSSFLGVNHARSSQRENLRRVIATLSDASFPLSEPVLRQMKGLSGAEFVFFDGGYRVQASTLLLSETERKYLQQRSFDHSSPSAPQRPRIVLAERSYLSQRVTVRGRPPIAPGGWLVVLYPEENWAATLWQATYPAILVGTAAIAALVVVTMLLAHRFVQPIRRLGDRAAAIAEGDFQPLKVARRNDEIRDLTICINRMAGRLSQFEKEVRRHEQLRTLGQLGAGLAHQLRNAATGGRMAIELHQMRCATREDEEEKESLDVALRQLRLMESYLQRFLALGQTRDAAHEPLSLELLVEDAIDLVRTRAAHAGIELVYNRRTSFGPEPTATERCCLGKSPSAVAVGSGLNEPSGTMVSGDADALRQLFVNLFINAIEAVSGNDAGQKRIAVEIASGGDRKAIVKISDSGPGVATRVAERLFEPFVTDKPEGTGLGLYVARQTADAHRGAIRCHRQDGMTCFEVELPQERTEFTGALLNE
jgi:signal transduction histidine kinase